MEGWIKIHKQIQEWGWYDSPSVFCLFIHLLVMANWKEEVWHGEHIGIGQVVTGRKQLAAVTGLSEQQIRTALNRLKSTNEITIKATNKFSIITICNYERYQSTFADSNQQPNQQPNQQVTIKQPSTNHNRRTKERKNEDLSKEITTTSCSKERFVIPSLEEVSQYCQERHNDVDAEQFCDYYESNGWKVGKNSMKDWKAAVRNWEKSNNKTIAHDFKRNDRRRGNDVPSTPNYTQGF